MTGIYKPTLEDIAYLANEHPEKFKNANETLRSIENVMNHDPVVRASTEDATIINQYEDYLKRGGEHLSDSPIPAELTAKDSGIKDPNFSSANCECKSKGPCCVKKMEIGCAHKSIRIEIPSTDKKSCDLYMVADKNKKSGFVDTIKAKINFDKKDYCCYRNGPYIVIDGQNDSHIGGGQIEQDVKINSNGFLGYGDAEKFYNLTFGMLSGNTDESLSDKYEVSVINCDSSKEFVSNVYLFPKATWESKALFIENTITCYSSGKKPEYEFKSGGSFSGVYAGSKFEISFEDMSDKGKGDEVSKSFPFLSAVANALNNDLIETQKRAGVLQRDSSDKTASFVKVTQNLNLGESKFELVEHGSINNRLGIKSEISFGFNPAFEIKAKIDLIDAILLAARANPPIAPLATAIRSARNSLSNGIGTDDVNIEAHVAIYMEFTTSIAGVLKFDRETDDDDWNRSGEIVGKILPKIGGEVTAKGKMYYIEGALNASANVECEVSLKVESSDDRDKGIAKCTLGTNGVLLKYKSAMKGKIGVFSREKSSSGKIPLSQKKVFFENYI